MGSSTNPVTAVGVDYSTNGFAPATGLEQPIDNALEISSGPLIDSTTNASGAIRALFVGIGLLMAGNALSGTLIGIRSGTEGFSPTTTGLIMAAYFIGILAGSRGTLKFLREVGHIRVFAALASLVSTAVLLFSVAAVPALWIGMRFVIGFCMSGLYVVAESWINDLATNANRGRLLAGYMAVTMGGMAAGQFLLNLASTDGFELFVIASIAVSLAILPVTLSATASPPTAPVEAIPLKILLGKVPTGVTTSFFVGMAHGVLLGMGAVYASGVGFDPFRIAVFMGAPMLGGVLFQFPIGSISDRVPRRRMILLTAALASALAVFMAGTDPDSYIVFPAMFLLGGMTFPLYSLGIALTNDWLEPNEIMGASSVLVTVSSVGAAIGPLLAAGLIQLFGLHQFFITLLFAHGAIVVYILVRMMISDPLPTDKQGRFVAYPARASAVAASLLLKRPRRRRNEQPAATPTRQTFSP